MPSPSAPATASQLDMFSWHCAIDAAIPVLPVMQTGDGALHLSHGFAFSVLVPAGSIFLS